MSTFDPEGFFKHASSLIRDQTSDEAALRSAISRSYYSAFLTARDKLFGTDETYLTNAKKKVIV